MKKIPILLALIMLGLTTFFMISCGSGGLQKPPGEDPITPITIPDDGEIPSLPRNVTAQAGNRVAMVSWNSVYGASGYRIYQSDDGVTFIRLTGSANLTGTQAVIIQLQNGRTYYFGVTAVDERSNESGIAYAGGSPTALPIIPMDPYVEPTIPSKPSQLKYVPGDRKVMITWEYNDDIDELDKFSLQRKMNIDPLASVPNREVTIPLYESLFDARVNLPTMFDDYPVGEFVSGFTIPAMPYFIDRGIRMVGLPPNYLPLGLVDGDVNFEYTVGAWIGDYSAMAKVRNVVPLDLPPSAPVLRAVFLVPSDANELGIGIKVEWLQPKAPENSDIKDYILKRVQTDTNLAIYQMIEAPFSEMQFSVSYTDTAFIPGKTYTYQIFAQDYYAQIGDGSNIVPITLPGTPGPIEPEE